MRDCCGSEIVVGLLFTAQLGDAGASLSDPEIHGLVFTCYGAVFHIAGRCL